MSNFPSTFLCAFNFSMRFEVGSFWNPTDPDVIAGKCATREQQRKVGYVNHPADPGGLTKFGVAQNANPSLNIKTLTLAGAMQVYFDKYWMMSACPSVGAPGIQIVLFDCAINHGVTRAKKLLQQAIGVTADGAIGPVTLGKLNSLPAQTVINRMCNLRVDLYNSIVANKPSQKVFINGWLTRAEQVRNFALSK